MKAKRIKQQKCTIRYYMPVVSDRDQNKKSLYDLFVDILENQDGLADHKDWEEKSYQLRLERHKFSESVICGCFVKFIEESPVIGTKTTKEEEIHPLPEGKDILSKSYFVLFRENGNELIAYQRGMESPTISALSVYFSKLFSYHSKFNDIVIGNTFEKIEQGIIKSVEYEVAMPRLKSYMPSQDTWTQDAFEKLNNTGSTRFYAKLSTRSKSLGLFSNIKEHIMGLLSSESTKLLKVKLSDFDEPIDLLIERTKDIVYIELVDNHLQNERVFDAIIDSKNKNSVLIPYLATENEALE